ncbi:MULTISPECIES: magnesium transporter CorA family protein [Chryseobacterium]|jgi:magnesium transporter|uniref:Magnesium transport protein CorA n=1 Tax=Chryseobacterium indoltheticum TaxID=254 RepID=A0A381JRD3_9FLAO|nr:MULTISPECIES: CorA family divalent cation transporter [Chryseobacterium]AZA62670.1 magnesium transporter CorA [Chryseobacterium indoltheticum]AZA75305.1 magnesium transporter CorA [Chryseobacterium indoltheticum]MDF2834095.1 magnesium transporter CorA [Chryseobacterium indoltheticum]MDQ8144247.1 CorA family divalent cation transporter [Chryseobacterium sp. CFS15]QQQ27963.1 magnesium transporter CorA [Chryseobacterium indoltheticum]
MPIDTIYRDSGCEWIDVEAPTQEDMKYLHERYEINNLLLEDTLDPNHLPKYEADGNVKFFLLRESTELERKNLNTISDISTKIGIFLVENTIITVHRLKTKSITETKKQLSASQENCSPDKVALMIALVIMKSFDDESLSLFETMDNIENEIFLKNTNHTNQIRRLYKLKRKSGLNSRVLTISTDAVDKFKLLNLPDSEFVDLKDKHKDVVADFDHLNIQITNLISMFLALSDQKANQVMKVLAIYSVYFLPITFIAGLYGMNFDNMPELHTKQGYFYTLGTMGVIVICTFIYARRKQW